jgi:DNA-binding Lrp family transcriptional regulator
MPRDPAAAPTGRPGSGHDSQPEWTVPWAEPPAGGEQRPERADLEMAFFTAMRQTGALMQLMTQAAADRVGINATDMQCLNILSFRGQMTAGELAKATGLTTASITGVIDRLEEAGFVRRERDARDRRRVMVELSAGPGLSKVASTFAPVIKAWRTAAGGYSDDELRLLLAFQLQLEQIVRDQLARMRSPSAGPS